MFSGTDLTGKSDTELVDLITRLENSVREEQRFRRIIDDMGEGFLIIGFDWRYSYVNQAGARMCQMEVKQMKGKKIFDLFPGVETSNFFHELKVCMEQRIPLRFENRFVYDDLSINWYEILLQPVKEGISVLVSDVTVRRYREDQLNRAKDLLVQRIEWRTSQLESTNSDMRDSIMYARQIQKAFLPPLTDLQKSFPDSFVLLQPKDLVSGDFFWMRRAGNKTVIAVADCTGHGVPGALLSIIGAQSLCDAVDDSEDPSQILRQLNMRMKRALRQSEDPRSTRDGMDICLCVFDNETSKLYFSGAHRPLYLIRRNAGGEVEEIKGTRTAIAGFTANDKEFETHTIELDSGDCIYLTSDGYADQDGGERGKKLKTRHFKEVLTKVSDYSMSEQRRRLKHYFSTWKGERPQMDDVIVVGIRI